MRGFLTNKIGIGKEQLSSLYSLDVSGQISFDSSLNMNNQRVCNIANPITSTDAVNRTYVDTSLSFYATNTSVNIGIYSNASLGLAFDRFTNVSLGLANNSYATNASVNLAFLTNPSLGGGDVTKAYVDACLGEYATNASINLAFLTNVSLGFAFDQYANASLGLVFDQYTNVSLGLVGTATTTLAALTDVSIVSIAGNNLLQYDSSFSLWMNVAPVDACSYFYTKSQIDASFATNASVNKAIYSNASLGLVGWLDASVKAAFTKNNSQDASITRIDSSLNNAFLLSSYVNTSEYYDGSLNRLNASLGDAMVIGSYVNTSSYYDGSLNARFRKYPGNIVGLKDASGNEGDMFVLDASLYIKLSSMWLHITCASSYFG